jgi:hypothetical protein
VQKEEKNEPETQARSLLNFGLDFPSGSAGRNPLERAIQHCGSEPQQDPELFDSSVTIFLNEKCIAYVEMR